MHPDFSKSYSQFIADDGTMTPPLMLLAPDAITWAADPDGLMMTITLPAIDGEACVLTAIFPMSMGAAMAKHRQRRFPVASGDYVSVVRKLDEVQGSSGERYCRFIVEVAKPTSTAGK